MQSKMEETINWFSPKFAEELRTFKTRVEFIDSIFSNLFEPEIILGRCIQHKLKGVYESYVAEVEKSYKALESANAVKVLKEMNKE